MKIYHRFWLIGIVMIAALLVAACAAPAGPAPAEPAEPAEEPVVAPEAEREERVLTIGIGGDIETVDPGFGQAIRANETLKNIYDQPLRYARVDTGEGYEIADVTTMEGAAWESFELQPDGVTVKIKLREGVKFTGTDDEVTAEDWYFKFRRAFEGGVPATTWIANTVGISELDQVTVDGPYEMTIKLKEPTPLFGPLMRDQDFGIVNSKAIQENATDDDPWANKWLAKNYAGSGEYYIESWTPGVEMVLRANPDYWDGPAYFDKVVLKIIPSSADRVLLLQQGAIDIAEDLNLDEVEELRGAPGVKILSIPSRNQVMFGLNNALAPFDNVTVRQALSYAVPYEQIVRDIYHGQALVPKGAWPQKAQYFDEGTWPYEYDPEKAKELLKEAGYEGDLKFTLAIRSGSPEMENVAVVLQNAFRQIGVEMGIEKQAPAVFQEKLVKREHVAWMQPTLSYVDDPFYHLFLWFKTDTVINWFKYSNERVDEITDILANELDPEKRAELTREAQEIINSEAAGLFIAEPNFVLAMREDIEGFVLEPDHLLWYYGLRRSE